MANLEHIDILRQGINTWNSWRVEHPSIKPDLSGVAFLWANLEGANLSYTNLSNANLALANLSGADLSWTNLMGANLTG